MFANIISEMKFSTLPYIDFSVPAGFPSPAQDFLENRIDLNEKLIIHPSATFLIRIEGDSMIGEGIKPGCTAIIDRAIEPVPGKVVLAVLDGEFTVKKLFKKEGVYYLVAANKKYPAIKITEDRDFQVWGVVTWILNPLNNKQCIMV